MAQRWSAKNVVLVLMIGWGLAAMSAGLVQSRDLFLVARFALGVFEGGIWPAVLILAPLSGILLDHLSWRTARSSS